MSTTTTATTTPITQNLTVAVTLLPQVAVENIILRKNKTVKNNCET